MIYIKTTILLTCFLSVYKIIQSYGKTKKNQLQELENYRHLLIDIKGEVENSNMPIVRIIQNNITNYSPSFIKFFKIFIHINKYENTNPKDAFTEALKKSDDCFSFYKEHKKLFINFKNLFLASDKSSLISSINLLLQRVSSEIEYLKIDAKDDENLFNKLSVLAGLTVVIVLI